MLGLHPDQEQHQALRAQHIYERSHLTRKQKYARRAGIEGTISQGVRGFDLRRSRSIGLAKTRLQHLFVAASLNMIRMGAWLMEKPLAQTRRSRFKKIMNSETVQISV